MNNAGFLAEDFQQIKAKSDDAVFDLLKNRESKNSDKEQKPNAAAKSVEDLPKKKADLPPSHKVKNSNTAFKPKQVASKEWGMPVALFNTRIPQELSDLLDDLVYKSKKEGTPITKQAFAIEALKDCLEKHKILSL